MDSHCYMCYQPTATDTENYNINCVEVEGGPCVHCAQLEELDFQANEVKENLRRILDMRKQQLTARNHHHDPFTSRLPLELATRIFKYCLPPIPTIDNFGCSPRFIDLGYGIPSTARPQFLLGAVCRAWRRILWSNPEFWNVLKMVLTPSSPLFLGNTIKEWIRRSRNFPLYIYLLYTDSKQIRRVQHHHKIDIPTLLRSVVNTLSSCAPRWSIVELGLPAIYMSQLQCDPSITVGARGLCLLLTSASAGMSVPANARQVRFDGSFNLSVKPRPERLHLTSFLLVNVSMDWSCLTHFDGQYFRLDECLEIMRRAPRMTHFFLHSVVPIRQPLQLPLFPIVHTSIQTLHFVQCCKEIWDLITCPSLSNLTLGGKFQVSPDLQRFVVRSGHALIHLSLNIELGQEPELIELLKQLPMLQHLDLGNPLLDPFFTYLGETTYRDENVNEREAFLPRLRKLTFTGDRTFSWSSVHLLSPPNQPEQRQLRRPLDNIILSVTYTLDGVQPPDREVPFQDAEQVDYIDRHSLEQILECIKEGVGFDIYFDDRDIIYPSKQRYGMIEGECSTSRKAEEMSELEIN
ncbi:hypothetical protein CPB83DRAFT_907358 [Crepidotus variabilis]|uniref:F-box domain-containing protein n=1 Tax=Crepidotus variabilis TaxID=179855 RepID=A0A9P6EF39_9AGAR|nr:hypothetical protein CPB83DRAFT_907358 [Crepidotus variabilis]